MKVYNSEDTPTKLYREQFDLLYSASCPDETLSFQAYGLDAFTKHDLCRLNSFTAVPGIRGAHNPFYYLKDVSR